MRLIHTSTRKLHEFYDDIPEYAILSHTWDGREMTLQDFNRVDAESLPGFEKVDKCCKLAASRGFEYVWIDTCCIDKSSSAELQEAINSMYRWYKNSAVCFAYLSDVSSKRDMTSSTAFKESLWFKRGWTLQELIAPRTVEFYGKDDAGMWGEIGTKSSLRSAITEVTGIPVDVLRTGNLQGISVATRMSWASRRKTKRVEDEAYSLMGIFDVHMPMVYGEGKRAFERLQAEIMKVSNDHSLFAWKSSTRRLRHWKGQGLLADSPADFMHSGQYRCSSNGENPAPYQVTNLGLRMRLLLIRVPLNQVPLESEDEEYGDEEVTVAPEIREYYGVLNCCSSSMTLHRLGIILRLVQTENGERCLRGSRCRTKKIIDLPPLEVAKAERKTIYIVWNAEYTYLQQESPYIDCTISLETNSPRTIEFVDAWPGCEAGATLKAKGRTSKGILAAVILKYIPDIREMKIAIVIGLFDGEAWCDVVRDGRERDAKTIWKSHKYIDQPDRMSFALDGRLALSIAIRKKGRGGSKTPTLKEFTLCIDEVRVDN